MIGSILYAMLVIYVIVCIVLWGMLLYAAGQGGAGAGFAIIFMVFVPFWPIAVPGYVSSSLSRWNNRPTADQNDKIEAEKQAASAIAYDDAQNARIAAEEKAKAAAARENVVAVVTDAKAAAAAPVVDTTAAVAATAPVQNK